MNRWRISVIGLALMMQACVSTSEFPKTGPHRFTQSKEFDLLEAKAGTYEGTAVQMAGRIVDVIEQPNRETLIVADWLPFPEDAFLEPSQPRNVVEGPNHRFALLFPGKIDRAYEWKGNTFVTRAKVEGMKEVGGNQLPYLVGSCLRIWTTGLAYTDPMPWEEGGAKIDDRIQTYCLP